MKEKWRRYTFTDGTIIYVRKYNKQEKKVAELKYGKIIKEEIVYV